MANWLELPSGNFLDADTGNLIEVATYSNSDKWHVYLKHHGGGVAKKMYEGEGAGKLKMLRRELNIFLGAKTITLLPENE